MHYYIFKVNETDQEVTGQGETDEELNADFLKELINTFKGDIPAGRLWGAISLTETQKLIFGPQSD